MEPAVPAGNYERTAGTAVSRAAKSDRLLSHGEDTAAGHTGMFRM